MVASRHWLISQVHEPSYMGVWGLCPQLGFLEAKTIYFVNLVYNFCKCLYIHSQGIDSVMSNVSECDGTSVHYA